MRPGHKKNLQRLSFTATACELCFLKTAFSSLFQVMNQDIKSGATWRIKILLKLGINLGSHQGENTWQIWSWSCYLLLSSQIIPKFIYSGRKSRSLFSKDKLLYAWMSASRSPRTLASQPSALTQKCGDGRKCWCSLSGQHRWMAFVNN